MTKKAAYLLAYFDVVDGVFQPTQWSLATDEYQTQDLRLHGVVIAYGMGEDFGEGLVNLKAGLEALPTRSGRFCLRRLEELRPELF